MNSAGPRSRPHRSTWLRRRVRLFAGAVLTIGLVPIAAAAPGTAVVAQDAGQSIANSTRGVVVDVQVGAGHACALLTDGRVTCWGRDDAGQLGNGPGRNDQDSPPAPVTLPGGTTATAIAVGGQHTCALLHSGQVTCWGSDDDGRLGNGPSGADVESPPAPITLPGGATATAIATGGGHTCALLDSGQITCWGSDTSGQLGNGAPGGDVAAPPTPVSLPGGSTAIGVAAGRQFTCALLENGDVTCWGNDNTEELGNGPGSTDVNSPPAAISLPGGVPAIDVVTTSSADHTCALLGTGGITCWGRDAHGQIGNGPGNAPVDTPSAPVALPGGAQALSVTVGLEHTCALLATGEVSCWGRDEEGQLGTGPGTADQQLPQPPVTLQGGATAVSANFLSSCAVLDDGGITCWGRDGDGELGNGPATGDQQSPGAPIDLPDLDPVRRTVAVAAGSEHNCALLDTGQITCWGLNNFGQLGDGTRTNRSTPGLPVVLPGGATARAIAAGHRHTCALLDTGQITCWGQGTNGRLGNGITTDATTPPPPITLPGGANARAVTAGERHTCALLDTGQITCWGRNVNGQLGNGGAADVTTPPPPVALPGGAIARAVTADAESTCALLDTGQISCWGRNGNGQVGNGGTTNVTTPSPPITLPAGAAARSITAELNHLCALLDTGDISCWGSNSLGQLGDGTTTQRTSPAAPAALPAGAAATAVAAGSGSTCALLDIGQVTCWGRQDNGQLGNASSVNGSVTTPPAPIALPGGTAATSIASGRRHTCAVLTTAEIACWGVGLHGQLGNGDTAEQPSPVLVTFVPTDPTVAAATGQTTPTNGTTIDVSVTFDQPVDDFDPTDITLAGTAGATTVAISGTDTTYDLAITGMATDGTVEVSVPAGDVGHFGNTASNTVTIDVDIAGPIATIDRAVGQDATVTETPVAFSVMFDEAVTDFDLADVTIGGTAGATTADATLTGSGTAYTVSVASVPGPGTVTLSVANGAASDLLGNPSTTTIFANTVTVNDATPPVIDVPDDITVDTEPGALTATVTYNVTASDPASTAPRPGHSSGLQAPTASPLGIDAFGTTNLPVTCTPASGTAFAVGTTTVTCAASDPTGNTATADFTVTVNAVATTTTSTTTTTTTTTTTITPTTTAMPQPDPGTVLPATGNDQTSLHLTLWLALLATGLGATTVLVARRRS